MNNKRNKMKDECEKQDKVQSKKSFHGTKSKKGSNRTNPRSVTPGRGVANTGAPKGYSALNDVSWYSRNPELLAAAARIPFPYKPGMMIRPGSTQVNTKDTSLSFMVPGICRLSFYYSVGNSADVTSPASIAAKEMYARIRAKFSGALEADAPDIMMYSLAIDSIHSYIAFLKRIYRTVTLYSSQNRLVPEVLLYAMDVENGLLQDIQQNKTAFWGMINTLVNMANKFTVPDDMDLYKRHRWMNENVYLDEPMPNSQMYFFQPHNFWKVQTAGSSGTALKSIPFDIGTFTKATQLFKIGKDLIQALSDWDDAYTINGYMQRAYEGTAWYTAELLGQDEMLIPVYEPEVLMQIENFTGVGAVSKLDITQDVNTNAILHQPTATSQYQGANVLNLHIQEPTAADVTVATRMMGRIDGTGHVIAGTEIPKSVEYFYRAVDGAMLNVGCPYFTTYNVGEGSIGSFGNAIDPFLIRASFNNAPMAWVAAYSGDNVDVRFVGNLSNPTLIDDNALDELTRVCIYSEFNCFRT